MDIGIKAALLLAVLFAGQIAIQFRIHNGRPVTGDCAKFYQPQFENQNIDVPDWIQTGLMLPQGAINHRAPRPLWPGLIVIARGMGFVDWPLAGPSPASNMETAILQSLRVLQRANIVMAWLCMWAFAAGMRRLGHGVGSCAAATVVAGSGFGFSFWIPQAIPEVLSYFSVMLTLVAVTIATEMEERAADSSRFRSIRLWALVGFLVGFLTLGKELYNLNLFVALFLLWRRRWFGAGAFVLCSLLPVWLWNYYIVHIRHIFDPEKYARDYGFVVWLRNVIFHAPPMEKLGQLGKNLDTQISSFFRAFAYVPVFLMLIGMVKRPVPALRVPTALFLVSIAALFFASNFIQPRISFMAWPVVYLFCWRGVEWCADRVAGNAANLGWGRFLAPAVCGAWLLFFVWLQNQMLFAAYVYG